jgi:hypothetical protein
LPRLNSKTQRGTLQGVTSSSSSTSIIELSKVTYIDSVATTNNNAGKSFAIHGNSYNFTSYDPGNNVLRAYNVDQNAGTVTQYGGDVSTIGTSAPGAQKRIHATSNNVYIGRPFTGDGSIEEYNVGNVGTNTAPSLQATRVPGPSGAGRILVNGAVHLYYLTQGTDYWVGANRDGGLGTQHIDINQTLIYDVEAIYWLNGSRDVCVYISNEGNDTWRIITRIINSSKQITNSRIFTVTDSTAPLCHMAQVEGNLLLYVVYSQDRVDVYEWTGTADSGNWPTQPDASIDISTTVGYGQIATGGELLILKDTVYTWVGASPSLGGELVNTGQTIASLSGRDVTVTAAVQMQNRLIVAGCIDNTSNYSLEVFYHTYTTGNLI